MVSVPDIRSRLKAVASRKKSREQLLEDLRSGKYDGLIHDASSFFDEKEDRLEPPPAARVKSRLGLAEVLPGARTEEGPHGRTIMRSVTLGPGDAMGVYTMPRDLGADALLPAGGLHHLSKDIDEHANDTLSAGDICFLDTETTGLAGGTGTLAFLIGLGWWETDGGAPRFHVEQFLIDDFCHESDLLERVVGRLSRFRAVCTYNGKTYDMPLLRTRAALSRIPPKKLRLPNLDLLHFARRIWRGVLPSCSLKTVEKEILGIDRGPDIDGALIPEMFFHMARTGDARRMGAVADHNVWDIVSLGLLLRRQAAIARDPLGCGLLKKSGEFAAVARWMECRRLYDDAASAWNLALECAGREDDETALLERLALVYKRSARWPEALEIWENLRTRTRGAHLSAWIETAKYLEHRARNYDEALRVVRQCRHRFDLESQIGEITGRQQAASAIAALPELEKREARLCRRLEKAKKK